MCASWFIGQLIMPVEAIHLSDLFQHDEIYWVPADRPAVGTAGEINVVEAKDGTSAQQEKSQNVSVRPGAESVGPISVQEISVESQNTGSLAPDSFEHVPTLDAEASPKPVIPGTTWLVVGDLSGAERGRLQLIFSAPPMLLSEQDWAIYTPSANEPTLSEFITQARNKKFIFLGQQPAIWQSDFHVTEIVQHGDKLIYFFPRLLSTLTDAEKSLKLVFWNAIKDMK